MSIPYTNFIFGGKAAGFQAAGFQPPAVRKLCFSKVLIAANLAYNLIK